jgi:hypothetical protein
MRSTAASGVRIRALAVAGVCAALLAGMTVALDVATASAGPQAAVAKKKCKKKPRSAASAKKKCKKQGAAADPVAAATAFIAGHSFSYLRYSSTGASTQYRFEFCGNGTYHVRGDYVGYSGNAWADSYDGTWHVTSGTGTSAQVAFATSNYQVSDPSYASPPPASGTVGVQAQSETVVLIAGVEFSRGTGSC